MIPPQTRQLVAKTLSGLEDLLAAELEALGATGIQRLTRAVAFEGDKALIYKANYQSRYAIKILVPLVEFEAATVEELYEGVKRYDWEQLMTFRDTFVVESVLVNAPFDHSHYISLKVKDAVADWFNEKYHRRPSVSKDNADIHLSLYVNRTHCTLYLDSSGEPLFKRGYRVAVGEAPISEVLAAGLIGLTGWKGEVNFVDPFCGSGTLLIEAAMQAQNIPAGQYRQHFGFMRWRDFDRLLWNDIKSDARKRRRNQEVEIFGSDMDEKALQNAHKNVRRAGLENDITLNRADFRETSFDGPGVLVCNPPYGERLKPDDIVALYKSIGDTLKHNYKGFDAWIISSDFYAFKHIGLKPKPKFTLYNGPLECRFARFEIYEGSRRARYQSPDNGETPEE